MPIDMDDTILSAYGRPELAWNSVTAEFAVEFAPRWRQRRMLNRDRPVMTH
jgi:hypothetical protein